MTRLSPFDADRNPFPAGTRVKVRPVEDWAGSDAELTRPVMCEYEEVGAGMRHLSWGVELDLLVGKEFDIVAPSPSDRTSLPAIRVVGMYGLASVYAMHPDFVEMVTPADPLGLPCCCLIPVLMVSGCQPACGRMRRERRAARR